MAVNNDFSSGGELGCQARIDTDGKVYLYNTSDTSHNFIIDITYISA
jgi:hypothetical protein